MAANKRARKGAAKTYTKKAKKPVDPFRLPDVKPLERVNPKSTTSVQPEWIAKKHPEYVAHDMMHHALTSERQFHHAGHHVKITTSYEIEIDGVPVRFHALVDNDGQLRCHTTPYETYSSATALVKKLIDRFPESFAQLGGGAGPGHGHHHGGQEGS